MNRLGLCGLAPGGHSPGGQSPGGQAGWLALRAGKLGQEGCGWFGRKWGGQSLYPRAHHRDNREELQRQKREYIKATMIFDFVTLHRRPLPNDPTDSTHALSLCSSQTMYHSWKTALMESQSQLRANLPGLCLLEIWIKLFKRLKLFPRVQTLWSKTVYPILVL